MTAQRALLRAKRDRLDGLLRLVEAALKGETTMEMAFTAFDRAGYEEKCRAYAREVKARWGILRPGRKTRRDSNPARRQPGGCPGRGGRADRGLCPEQAAASRAPQVQALTGRWQAHITRHHYCCTRQTLAGLGELYRTDQRFQAYLDQWGTGTAAQMAAAIAVYCGAQEEDASPKK
ncbi:MAG: TipAS antibiotic-recognition domain-containing protein [Evtepia gabavorous]